MYIPWTDENTCTAGNYNAFSIYTMYGFSLIYIKYFIKIMRMQWGCLSDICIKGISGAAFFFAVR